MNTSRSGNCAGRHFDTTAVSAICTAAFTLYHAFLGLWHASVWHGSISAFYALLTAVRGNILATEKLPPMQRARRRRTARVNALLLVALDALMLPPVAMLVLLARLTHFFPRHDKGTQPKGCVPVLFPRGSFLSRVYFYACILLYCASSEEKDCVNISLPSAS